jgi:hypothetical protein
MHKHSKPHNKIVRHVLKRIANQTQVLYPDIKKKFVVDCDIEISLRFWELLKEEYPNHSYTEVSCCPDCGKFDLE